MTNTISWSLYKGDYEISPGTSTLISNVQTADVSWGRRNVIDQMASGSYFVSGRRPDLLPALAIGDVMSLVAVDGVSSNYVIRFFLSDYRVRYGKTSAQDVWEISGEDALAIMGRTQVSQTFPANTTFDGAANGICTSASVTYVSDPLDLLPVNIQASTVTNTPVLEQLQKLCNSYILGIPSQRLYASSRVERANINPDTFTLSDSVTPTTAYQAKYTSLEFGGIAENYAPKVSVEAPSKTTQTVGSGTRTYVMQALNDDTSIMLDNAYRMSALLAGDYSVPMTVSYSASQQPSTTKPLMHRGLHQTVSYCPGFCEITFRGTTYYTFVLGCSISATPEDTLVTWRLASAAWLAAFTLDSSSLGVLDTNRLGV